MFDPLVDEAPSRFVVGIDLGTTNSAVAYVDTEATPWRVREFAIPQLVAAGQVESRETLPSFHYQAASAEAERGALRLPWSSDDPVHAVGFYARDEGMSTPGRLIASAKSWLCHTGVDRMADLLPWQGASDVERMSPVEVTARYLRHIRDAWDAQFRGQPLARQQLVITLPASFDEVARELAVQAAAAADLPRVVLIEEPQAAFYAWVYKHADDWRERVEPGQKILVCDIGGGTSDFTLIQVRSAEPGEQEERPQAANEDELTLGQDKPAPVARSNLARGAQTPRGASSERIQFHRVAVGDHLILGGDNLDLALAGHVERKLAGDGKLSPQQWDVLARKSRQVKEVLLGEDPPDSLTVHLPGSGSRLIGGGVQAEVEREEVERLLVEGFLPSTEWGEKPVNRQSGFQEFGLPFAADHGMTRYLSAFLHAHRDRDAEDSTNLGARPDIVLFNGGFFASPVLRSRLIDVLSSWFQDSTPGWQPTVLDNERLDLAVARGAAYYGMVQRGEGVKIAASLARSYYIGVEHEDPVAVCLVPGEAEPGQEVHLADQTFQLTISEPVEFPLFVSSTRLTDRPGDVVTIDREQMSSLPPIRTVLRTDRRNQRGTVDVQLHARLTEIGTIDLWCADKAEQNTWRLQFDIRAATQTDVAAHESAAESQGFVDESRWSACRACIENVFGSECGEKPSTLMKRLASAFGADKQQWPTSFLRRVWETLMELEPGRKQSAAHEGRWLNLLGYALRPGYGFAVDDWRVSETWRTVRGKLAHRASTEQSLILFRRIAGGLSRGQQLAIAEAGLSSIRVLHRRFAGKQRGELLINPAESVEIWRLLGSLELLPVPLKVELGDIICDLFAKPKMKKVCDAMVWALGRLGQRVPVYGPLNTVVARDRAEKWIEALMRLDRGEPIEMLAAMQLARRSNDRHRDLSDTLRDDVIGWMERREAADHLVTLVGQGGSLESDEQSQVLGESLPKGLRIQ